MPELDVLREIGCSTSVIKHCQAVSKKAQDIGDKVTFDIDKNLIKSGALLHDIGRCKTHAIDHGVVGAELARELGFSEKIVKIIERHIGAGITTKEAEVLGLPIKDYSPITPEEKIVSYADTLTFGNRHVSFKEGLNKFKKILGDSHSSIEKLEKLHLEITQWINKPNE